MSLIQRVVLSLVCTLALVLIPASNLLAQQDTSAPDQTQEQTQPDSTLDQDPALDQDPDAVDDSATDSEFQQDDSAADLPDTAGGLPLLALLGAASLVGARLTRK